MKLQLALDELPLDDALALAESVRDYVDIIEIGTPFVIARGMDVVRRFRERFPEKEILSDEKIMDGSYFESQLAFNAGADYVTALGVTDILTVKACLRAAQESGKQLVIDMICVDDSIYPAESPSWKPPESKAWRCIPAPTSKPQGANPSKISK